MKKIIICFLLLCTFGGISQVNVVNDIAALESFSGTDTVLIVKDTLRGGTFSYENINHSVDNGIYFSAIGKGSGVWIRQFNVEEGLNILWYGADPTNNNDNASLLENVCVDYSYQTNGKVFFPKGIYKISSGIGGIGSHSNPVYLKNDLTLIGDGGAVIKVDTTLVAEIPLIIGFETQGFNVSVENIGFDGSNIANRGVYFRDVNSSTPRSSYINYSRLSVKNIYMGENPAENNCSAITFYGKTTLLTIDGCIVEDVHSIVGEVNIGISFSGNAINDRYPINARITNNNIKNVFVSNALVHDDQDGINGGMPLSSLRMGNIIVSGNKITNCRGRAIKIQQPNVIIMNNEIELTPDFLMPSTHLSGAVEVQYADGIVTSNKFNLNNTDGKYYQEAIQFTERATDTLMHRAICSNNIVFIKNGVMNEFINIYDDSGAQRSAEVVVSNNVIDGSVKRFMRCINSTSLQGNRYVVFASNSVRKITDQFLYNTNSSELKIHLALQDNVHKGIPVNIGGVYQSANLINNKGFIQSDTYAKATEIPIIDVTPVNGNILHGISSDWAYDYTQTVTGVFNILGLGTSATISNDWNTINQTGFYTNASSTTPGVPVAFPKQAMIHIESAAGIANAAQVTFSTNTNRMYFRRANSSGNWQPWQEMVTTGDTQTISAIKTFSNGIISSRYSLSALNVAPVSSTDTGTAGEVRITADYIYVCTATNTWKRTPLSTW